MASARICSAMSNVRTGRPSAAAPASSRALPPSGAADISRHTVPCRQWLALGTLATGRSSKLASDQQTFTLRRAHRLLRATTHSSEMTIQRQLVRLVVACVVPAALAAALLIVYSYQR